jgi:hypothetical protein
MRGMIVLVTVMSLLLLAGLGLFAYGIATKTGLRAKAPAQALTEVVLPSVSSIQTMSAWKNGIAMYVASPKGDFLYFIDPEQKAQLRVPLRRADDAVQAP